MQNDTLYLDELNIAQIQQLICTLQTDKKVFQADNETLHETLLKAVKKNDALSNKVSIDNNPTENTIRPWALGRKNWLFVGNENGGEMAAIINSLAISCRENKVGFEAWMNDILPKLSEVKSKDIDTLLPHLWEQTDTKE